MWIRDNAGMPFIKAATATACIGAGLAVCIAAGHALAPWSSTSSMRARSQEEVAVLDQFRERVRSYSTCVKASVRQECETESKSILAAIHELDAKSFDYHLSSHFDVYLYRDSLFLFRNNCSEDDIRDKIFAWSAWRADPPLKGSKKSSGEFGQYHSFDAEGRFVDRRCFLAVLLPIEDIGKISIAMLNMEKTDAFWRLSDIEPGQDASQD